MNYNNDMYINIRKKQNVSEGNPQPTSDYKKPNIKDNKQAKMNVAKQSLASRGHVGSKEHPRG